MFVLDACSFTHSYRTMARLQRLLLARDFSSGSDAALSLALSLGQHLGAEVHTLFADVLQPDPFDPPPEKAGALDRLRMRFRQRARETVQRAGYEPDDVRMVHEVIQDAAPGPAILRYADENDIDLIIMGTHGRRGVRKALLGSVATEVVRLAPCPVLTVRPDQRTSAQNIQHLIVPIDFSDATPDVLAYADGLAQHLEAELTLVHSVETFAVPEVYGITPSAFVTREVHANVRTKMEELASELSATTHTAVLSGNAAAAIEDYVDEHDVDLIVLPTRGQTGLKRFLMGSVAERIIARAVCPVLSAKDFQPFLT